MKAEDLQKTEAKPAAVMFALNLAFDDGRDHACAVCTAPTQRYVAIAKGKVPLCAGHMNIHAARDMAARLGHKIEAQVEEETCT